MGKREGTTGQGGHRLSEVSTTTIWTAVGRLHAPKTGHDSKNRRERSHVDLGTTPLLLQTSRSARRLRQLKAIHNQLTKIIEAKEV